MCIEQTTVYLRSVTSIAAPENFEATTLGHHGMTNLTQENLNSWYLSTGNTVHITYFL
jgi:hypothetical protein